ncbi:hypothetical protein ACFVP3_07580 [Streptomyces sp. NPDC057806]|uniref:hypothetical protein n=1 Tax=Streptomyces sp. NPDC057806 TaxID=3346255 RepID=UPI00368651C8
MAVPQVALTDSQHRLLAELILSPLPISANEEAAVARGLAPDQLQNDVPTLQWMGLITKARGAIVATVQGVAVFHRTEQEKAEGRLADVVAFADAVESDAGVDQCRIAPALRRLAQGGCSLVEAIGYLHPAS